MNGFRMHGLTHTSASQENLWVNAPDVWVAQYLHNMRTPMGADAARGTATEKIVAAVLSGASMEHASADALRWFDGEFAFTAEDPSDARKIIVPCAEQAMLALKDAGLTVEAPALQSKIVLPMRGDGWELDCIGYTDFEFPGEVVDLKTTKRANSGMSPEHRRQRCIYAAARHNSRVRFLYVWPKGFVWREEGDVAETLAEIRTNMSRRERFLRLGDRDLLAGVVPVNASSFYWRGGEAIRRQLYSL